MKVFLNIGIKAEAEFSIVISRVRSFFPRSIGEIQSSRKISAVEDKTSSTAVVIFETAAPKSAVLQVIRHLCAGLNLDLASILFEDGEGRLVGSNADKSGPFDIQRFRSPSFMEAAA